jgi:hypothetical protein
LEQTKGLTETIFTRHTFNDRELIDLGRKLSSAERKIREKEDELKTASTTIKADIAGLEAIINGAAAKLEAGYEMLDKECALRYEGGMAKYYDIDTGEFLQEREMRPGEQMSITGTGAFKDAEVIIRAESKRIEDEEAAAEAKERKNKKGK